jgi:hypothetical protein
MIDARPPLPLPALLSLLLAACGGATEPAVDLDDDLARRQLTEQRMEVLAETARELRDRAGGATPDWDAVAAATRAQHATDAEAMLLDGWSRPLRYESLHASDATSVNIGFRFWSTGADGIDQYGRGDDLVRETRVTLGTGG